MRLYHSAMSISLSCRLALVAAEAEHEITPVNSLGGETTREPFLSINPLGQVPVLECDGVILTQAVAILSFIAERTGKGWKHDSDLIRAKALSVMILTSVEIQNSWTMNNRPERFVSSESSYPEVVTLGLTRLEKAYNEIERQLTFLPADRDLGILDYYVAVFALWKSLVPAVSGFTPTPLLDAVKGRVMSTPRLQQVVEEDLATHIARVS